MLKVYKYTKRGVVVGTIKDLGNKAICWADLFKPNKAELKKISEITNISDYDLKEALDEGERPKVLDLDKYSLITFRVPFLEHEETHISTASIAIFISKNKNNIITLRTTEIASIENLRQRLFETNNLLQRGTTFFLYRILDEILNSYFHIFDTLEDKIDKIEYDVLKKNDKAKIKKIF